MNRAELAGVWPPNHRVAGLAGHEPMSPMQAIRRKCLDCSGQQLVEVKHCETISCPLWPFRAGRHPYTKTRLLEADSEQPPSADTPEPRHCSSSGIGLLEASGGQGGATKAEAAIMASAGEAV